MNKKRLKELIDYSIERLKRDNSRDFIIKNNMNKYDIYEIINNKECYVYGSQDLDKIHDSLCVIYNFLQTEKYVEIIKEALPEKLNKIEVET